MIKKQKLWSIINEIHCLEFDAEMSGDFYLKNVLREASGILSGIYYQYLKRRN